MKNCGLMPCEVEHGFDAQGNEKKPVLRSRTQWKVLGRCVVVESSEAVRILPRNGHNLCLFDVSQTVLTEKF